MSLHAAVLHPQHKLSYFNDLKWPQEWIKTAQALVREEFDNGYAAQFGAIKSTEPPQEALVRFSPPSSLPVINHTVVIS